MTDCPFYAGSTITDPRFFVGRRDILKLLSDRMTSPQPTSINIVGRSKTGKSSLLWRFKETYRELVPNPERYRVIYLSLQETVCHTETSFYQAIIEAFGQSPESPLNRQVFNDWLRGLKAQNISPVLCIDEFEELIARPDKFPNDFYDNLRFLLDSNCLMMVVASKEMLDLYSKDKRITSDFFNVFQTENLNDGFSEQEAKKVVSLQNSAREKLTADLQEIALRWGKNQPLLLQLAGQKLWDMQQYRKSQKWAKKRFQEQAKRFKVQPESQLISTVFKTTTWIGKISLWVLDNKEAICGLFVIGIGLGVYFLFALDFISLSQIIEFLGISSGE